MAAKTKPRRKVVAKAEVTQTPALALRLDRKKGLEKLTTPELKRLLRAAGLGIPKTKDEMAWRLAESPLVQVDMAVEAVVFDRPKS